MLGPLHGNTEKQVHGAVQLTGDENVNSENVSKVLKCNMFGGQNRAIR